MVKFKHEVEFCEVPNRREMRYQYSIMMHDDAETNSTAMLMAVEERQVNLYGKLDCVND